MNQLILPWVHQASAERVASTWDIKRALELVEPGSFNEFSLCYEAALDKDRPLSERERYLLLENQYGLRDPRTE